MAHNHPQKAQEHNYSQTAQVKTQWNNSHSYPTINVPRRMQGKKHLFTRDNWHISCLGTWQDIQNIPVEAMPWGNKDEKYAHMEASSQLTLPPCRWRSHHLHMPTRCQALTTYCLRGPGRYIDQHVERYFLHIINYLPWLYIRKNHRYTVCSCKIGEKSIPSSFQRMNHSSKVKN